MRKKLNLQIKDSFMAVKDHSTLPMIVPTIKEIPPSSPIVLGTTVSLLSAAVRAPGSLTPPVDKEEVPS